MHTLVVRYTPRTGSHTAALLDHALAQVRGTVEVIDLASRPAAIFTPAAVDAYVQRNYLGQTPSAEGAQALAPMDADVERLLKADVLITAAPMYNFGLPAALKAFFDGVIQKGRTWNADANGYQGLMKGRKALALFSSGGVYEGANSYDTYTPLARILLGFMGYEAEVIGAMGTNQDAAAALAKAKAEVDARLPAWYAGA